MASKRIQDLSSVAPAMFTPFLNPPPGVTSNPERPESLTSLADITIGICLPLITLFFLGRCYVRLFMKRAWVCEDYLVATAWAGSVGYCAVMRATISHHGGQHGWDMTTSQAHEAFYWFNVTAIVYGSTIGVTKTALLMFYRRVFSPMRRSPFDIALVALMAIILGFYISNTLIKVVKIFGCAPRGQTWSKAIPGKCMDPVEFVDINGGFNSASDFVILLLPVHAVSKLQVSPSKRILVILGFTFGLWYVSTLPLTRLLVPWAWPKLRANIMLRILINHSGPVFATVGFVVRLRIAGDKDATWNQYVFFLWAAAELATAILCVCFPEVAFMFRKRNRRGSKARQRPSESQIRRVWNERVINKPSPSYLGRSLMSTKFSTRDDQDYLELHDRQNAYNVGFAPTDHSQRDEEPVGDGYCVESEVTVEHGDRRV